MLAVLWVTLATFGAGMAFGVVAIVAAAVLREDRQRALHMTVWQLLSLKLSQEIGHHRGSEHQAKHDNGS
jgi:hypothetical protein